MKNFFYSLFSILLMCILPVYSEAEEADKTVLMLKDLTEAHAAPGFETPVRKILLKLWSPFMDKIKIDGMKNIIGVFPGTIKNPKILIMAHMDEVGFYVRNITEDGFLHIDQAGGWIDQTLLSHRWVVMTSKGPVLGYTGIESSHAIQNLPVQPISSKEMFLDIGATNKNDAIEKYGMRLGLPVTPDSKFEVINRSDRYMNYSR